MRAAARAASSAATGRRQASRGLQAAVQIALTAEQMQLLDALPSIPKLTRCEPKHVLPLKRRQRRRFRGRGVAVRRVGAAGEQNREHRKHRRRNGKQRRRRFEQSGGHRQERRAQQGSQTLFPVRAHTPPKKPL